MRGSGEWLGGQVEGVWYVDEPRPATVAKALEGIVQRWERKSLRLVMPGKPDLTDKRMARRIAEVLQRASDARPSSMANRSGLHLQFGGIGGTADMGREVS